MRVGCNLNKLAKRVTLLVSPSNGNSKLYTISGCFSE